MITDEMLKRDAELRKAQDTAKELATTKGITDRIGNLEYILDKGYGKRDEASLFDFERIEIAGIRAELHKLRQRLPEKEMSAVETKDVAFAGSDTSAIEKTDATQESYGIFDYRPQQPEEIVAYVPMGALGPGECYYNPMTRVARPVPKNPI